MPDCVHAREFAALCVFLHAAGKGQLTDRYKYKSKMGPRAPLRSVLPPDKDSNQTLTASCRVDVWAGATLKPEDTEQQQKDDRGNNSKAIRHMGKEHSRT
ncbi:hypothetical protein XENORESO_000111 [Xenotaenia resolanae]|uniref:Uncharacterized protein n=1 Tax=Xenotaenia resolanae TaxID=208358 RepID=A0ABV0X3K0_9TELE